MSAEEAVALARVPLKQRIADLEAQLAAVTAERDQRTWHCTRDPVTAPCGNCDGCRYDQGQERFRLARRVDALTDMVRRLRGTHAENPQDVELYYEFTDDEDCADMVALLTEADALLTETATPQREGTDG